MKKYTAIIVDDEETHSALLKMYLKKYCIYIDVIAIANNTIEALEIYNLHKPQILFLDIQLNNNTIFSFIDAIEDFSGEIIMVSSYKEFAFEAIKYQITDFVLKPIEVDNLVVAVNKALLNIMQKETTDELPILGEIEVRYLAIANLDMIQLVAVEDIIFCEADGRYTDFFLTNKKTLTSSKNIGKYEEILRSNTNFFRIHHKYVVNLAHVKKINRIGGAYCLLNSGVTLPISKRRLEHLVKHLKLR